jgi:hypothetical protein
MYRYHNSGLSLKKFAATLAEENTRLVGDRARRSKGPDATWAAAMYADITLLERGPWGSTDATTIERHVRRLKKKGSVNPLDWPKGAPFWAERFKPRSVLLREIFSKFSKEEIRQLEAMPRHELLRKISSDFPKKNVRDILDIFGRLFGRK